MAARAKQPRKYPDLRYKFIRGLLDYERYQRTKHYQKSAAEWTSKAIVSLDLADEPVKSIPQAKKLEGIGAEVAKQLKYITDSAITKGEPPCPGRYCSAASALLVALLQGEEEEASYQELGNRICIAEEKVLDYASAICEEKFIARDLRRRGVTAEIDASICPAWWRMTILVGRGLVKKRSSKRQPVYELLPPGREIAQRLRGGGTEGAHVDPPHDLYRPGPSHTEPAEPGDYSDNIADDRMNSYHQDNCEEQHIGRVPLATDSGARGHMGYHKPLHNLTKAPLNNHRNRLSPPHTVTSAGYVREEHTYLTANSGVCGRNLAPPDTSQRALGVNTHQGGRGVNPGFVKNPPPRNMSEEALYTNDTGTDGLVLLVDTQEWGGDRVGLGELIRLLGRTGLRYRTKKLKIADYNWMWRCGDVEIELPIVLERKRADDLARSLRDGRYLSQKRKMMEWKESYQKRGVSATLKYLVEGSPEQYAVRCADGCGAVVKCGFPSVHQLNAKIGELDLDAHFDLVRSDGIEGTVDVLTLITVELQQRLDKGDFDTLAVQGQTHLDHNENKAALQMEQPEAIIEIEDSQETKLLMKEEGNVKANVTETRTVDPYGISSSQFEADVPLAQYHHGPGKAVSYQRAEPSRPLQPGEIPGTRGRYVPKEQLHKTANSYQAHTSQGRNASGEVSFDTGVPATGGFQGTFQSGRQHRFAPEDASPSSGSSARKTSRSDSLPLLEETVEPNRHTSGTKTGLASSSSKKKSQGIKYAAQLATIKSFLSDPDEEQILCLLDLYAGDSNKTVCALLDGHSSSNLSMKKPAPKPKSTPKSTPKRKKDFVPPSIKQSDIISTPSLASPKRLKLAPDDSFLEDTDIISGSEDESGNELWTPKGSSSEARKGRLYRMKKVKVNESVSGASTLSSSSLASPASTDDKSVPVKKADVSNISNDSEIFLDLPDSLPDLDDKDPPINEDGIPRNISMENIDDGALRKKALVSKYQEEISQIKSLIPNLSNFKIASVLENYNGSIDRATAALFDEQSQSMNSDGDDNSD